MKSLSIIILALVASSAYAAPIRAAWLPTRYHDSSEQDVYKMMQSLKSLGINRVYPCVWWNGFVTYNSATYSAFTGNRIKPWKDSLTWYVKAGRALGIQVIAWFEYGLMAKYNGYQGGFADVAKAKGLIIGTANGFTWMHPTKSADFIAGIMIDAFRYGVNGVQLDDHFCFPPALPGSSAAVLSQAAQMIVQKIRAKVPKAYISLSPSPLEHHIKTCNAKWYDWARLNLFNEYAPQLYHYSANAVIAETNKVLANIGKAVFVMGFAIDHTGEPIKVAELQGIVKYAKSKNINTCAWYARGILETYPSQYKAAWAS